MAVAAVVLAGGGSVRMGRPKQGLRLAGRTLLQRTVDGCLAAGCERVVVVAAEQAAWDYLAPDPRISTALEDPPDGGPVAGIVAGLDELDPGERDAVLLLACDLPRSPELVAALLAAAGGQILDRAVVPVDEEGWPQYLAALYPADALRRSIEQAPELRDVSVRRLMRTLEHRELVVDPQLLADVDDPAAARRAGLV